MTAARVFAGVDIGGTGVKVGIVTAEGKVVARALETYDAQGPKPQDVVDLAAAVLHKLLAKEHLGLADVTAVGVGCPGVVQDSSIVHVGGALNWGVVPLRQLFEDKLGKTVMVCNDADAAVSTEQWVGTARGGIKTFIMLTLGTGVGFGAVVNGQLARGGHNTVEGGHLIVERNGRLCGCTQRGCLEAYSSGGALIARAKENLHEGKISSLAKIPEKDINAEMIFKHAAEGDTLCKSLVDEAADYLGFACVNYARMMDPEIIVLSGGVAEAGETYIEQIRRAYAKYTWNFPDPTRIEKATAGYDSGIVGAVAVCRSELEKAAKLPVIVS